DNHRSNRVELQKISVDWRGGSGPSCEQHRAGAVGDEPLLLAKEALTVISRRRVEGAARLVAEGADLIIMDDGFQSARLA
ncbi:tetraacyldisaccharide 4'-kinase, partial [Rhizobium ruizarguesonis]